MKKSPTYLVVGGAIGAALIAVAWFIIGWPWFLVAVAALLYEGWTLINKYPGDTISEIIWKFAERPMIPFLFGAAFGWGITSGFLGNLWLVAALAFLMGHFFFQRHEDHVDQDPS